MTELDGALQSVTALACGAIRFVSCNMRSFAAFPGSAVTPEKYPAL